MLRNSQVFFSGKKNPALFFKIWGICWFSLIIKYHLSFWNNISIHFQYIDQCTVILLNFQTKRATALVTEILLIFRILPLKYICEHIRFGMS